MQSTFEATAQAHQQIQDVYITVDLTSSLPPLKRKADPSLAGLVDPAPTRTRHVRTPTPEPQIDVDAPRSTRSAPQNVAEESKGRIQILDLACNNPLLSYRGQLYSCHWAEPLGTDLLFTSVDEGEEKSYTPLRKLGSHDLVGKSHLRLVANAAEFRPRETSSATGDHESNATLGMSASALADGMPAKRKGTFLERFAALKTRKGEVDKVPMHSIRPPRVEVIQVMADHGHEHAQQQTFNEFQTMGTRESSSLIAGDSVAGGNDADLDQELLALADNGEGQANIHGRPNLQHDEEAQTDTRG